VKLAAAAFAASLPTHRRALLAADDEERAALALAALGPERMADRMAEAGRRAEVFARTWPTLAWSPEETPMAAALRSVAADAAVGRL
jgi:hypothetical protein